MIDGGYLDHVVSELGLFGKIDYRVFVNALAGDAPLLRAYYYHCLPYQSAAPSAEESHRLANMERFFASPDRIPRFTVRKGKLAYRGETADGTPLFEQKQVDILMATDIVLLSTKRSIGKLVLVTGDSDFLPAIRVAKDEGMLIRLAHGTGNSRPHNELWQQADERIVMSSEWFAQGIKPAIPGRD